MKKSYLVPGDDSSSEPSAPFHQTPLEGSRPAAPRALRTPVPRGTDPAFCLYAAWYYSTGATPAVSIKSMHSSRATAICLLLETSKEQRTQPRRTSNDTTQRTVRFINLLADNSKTTRKRKQGGSRKTHIKLPTSAAEAMNIFPVKPTRVIAFLRASFFTYDARGSSRRFFVCRPRYLPRT